MLPRLILLAIILIIILSSSSHSTEASEMEAKSLRIYFPLITKTVNCEVRGAWVKPYMISQAADRAEILQKITGAHLNTVFVLAPAVGNNRGWSSVSSFSKFLNQAKSSGLSVHAWVISRERPSLGLADYPSQSEQEAQARWVTQLISTYPKLDGVHLDYIRYDKYEVSTATGPYAHLPRVDEAKTVGVSKTVQRAYQELKRLFPDKKLTAAVKLIAYNGELSEGPFPKDGPPYFWQKGLPYQRENQQDALGWVKNGYIDAVLPMNYTMIDAHWNFDADQWKRNLGTNFSKVYMGLGWLTEAGEPNYGYDAAGVVRKIKYGRSIGLKGFAIFDLGDRNTPSGKDLQLINALTLDSAINKYDAPFEQIVPSCLASR